MCLCSSFQPKFYLFFWSSCKVNPCQSLCSFLKSHSWEVLSTEGLNWLLVHKVKLSTNACTVDTPPSVMVTSCKVRRREQCTWESTFLATELKLMRVGKLVKAWWLKFCLILLNALKSSPVLQSWNNFLVPPAVFTAASPMQLRW